MKRSLSNLEVDKLANLILLVAILMAIFRFFGPNLSWVHPHFYYDILPQSLANGSQIKLRDLIDIFQPRQDFEVRSRFLNYLVLAIDQKIRISVFGNFFIPSNFLPIITTLNIISCLFFYKILLYLFDKKYIAKIGTALYIVSIGFYSLIGNVYMAAKPVSSFLILYSMLLTTKYIKNDLSQIKFMAFNSSLILLGLFTDEILLVVILSYLFLFFFFYRKNQDNRNLNNNKLPPKVKKIKKLLQYKTNLEVPIFKKFRFILASFFGSVVIWVLLITFIVPLITKKYFNWNFPFWEFNLNLKNDINFGGGYPEGTKVDYLFIGSTILDNIFNIFIYQFVPIIFFNNGAYSELEYGQPGSLYRFGGLTIVGWLVILVVFLILVYLIAYKKEKGLLPALLVLMMSIIFFSVLQIKHVPRISGYIYGAAISIFFVLFVVLFLDKLANRKALSLNSFVFVFSLIITQFINGNEFNKRWDIFHRDWSNTAVMQIASLPLSDLEKNINTGVEIEPTIFEDFNIWYHYNNNSLDEYLKNQEISLKGMAFVLELRLGAASKVLNDGVYHCDIGGLQLACLGYGNK